MKYYFVEVLYDIGGESTILDISNFKINSVDLKIMFERWGVESFDDDCSLIKLTEITKKEYDDLSISILYSYQMCPF